MHHSEVVVLQVDARNAGEVAAFLVHEVSADPAADLWLLDPAAVGASAVVH